MPPELCKEALNGIQSIDEADSLVTDGAGDFGQEAISTILTVYFAISLSRQSST
jgi:hypothetical protein